MRYLDNLGKRIRYARKKKGMSQEALAEIIGKTSSAVGQYEIERNKPTIEMLIKISEACNVKLEWLIKGEGETEYQLETISSKPADKGAFGSQVEVSLREEIRELKQEKANLLEIIRNLSLGKDKVIEEFAAKAIEGTESVSSAVFASMARQQNALLAA